MNNDDQPEFDTPPWRELRDARLRDWIRNEDAVQVVLSWADCCELIDDIVDGDKEIPQEHAVRVLMDLWTELPLNPFWRSYGAALSPVLFSGIIDWLVANEYEKGGLEDKIKAFTLRDNYMNVIGPILNITRGPDVARALAVEIHRFFTRTETLEEYLEKLA